MAPRTGRTLHVRCATWAQVEVFHTRKLRRGKLLSMKVPFSADLGSTLTLGLELPNGVVIAIEGVVRKASPIESDAKTWMEVELVGFTEDVVARIRAMEASTEHVATPVQTLATREREQLATTEQRPLPKGTRRASQQMPPIEPVAYPGDQRQQFQTLTAELRRLRQLAVHEVLGVDRDADADEVRAGWMNLVRRYHPDLVARHHTPAITHLAEELTILANRAYDRLRVAMVAEGRAIARGSALRRPPGWLVGFDDISSAETHRPRMPSGSPSPIHTTGAPPTRSAQQGGEAFEVRARSMLGEGQFDNAQEVLAAALCVYPRSRPLRSLYYVASALGALSKGEVMLATSQLETALAHYEECTEAAAILEQVRIHGATDGAAMQGLFR